jgi:hypothetical protein
LAFADHDGDVGVQVDAADGQADDLAAVRAAGSGMRRVSAVFRRWRESRPSQA